DPEGSGRRATLTNDPDLQASGSYPGLVESMEGKAPCSLAMMPRRGAHQEFPGPALGLRAILSEHGRVLAFPCLFLLPQRMLGIGYHSTLGCGVGVRSSLSESWVSPAKRGS